MDDRAACNESSAEQTRAMFHEITFEWTHTATANFTGVSLPLWPMDLAKFLLTRGPFAWLGYGCKSPGFCATYLLWGGLCDCLYRCVPFTTGMGCGCDWQPGASHGAQPCSAEKIYPRPAAMEVDYGRPKDAICKETSAGVFTREWTKAT